MLGILTRLGLTLGCTRGVLRPAVDAAGLGLMRLEQLPRGDSLSLVAQVGLAGRLDVGVMTAFTQSGCSASGCDRCRCMSSISQGYGSGTGLGGLARWRRIASRA